MLGWGKRSEGSDMRATFERRREQIRQGVLGAGRVAGAGLQAAGAATLAGVRAAGAAARSGGHAARRAATAAVHRLPDRSSAVSMIAGVRGAGGAVRRAAHAGRSAATTGVQRALAGSATLATAARQRAQAATGSLRAVLARPIVPGVVAAAGTLALGAGIGRWRGAGLDGEAVVLLGVGTALLATLAPMAFGHLAGTYPRLASPLVATAIVGIAVLAIAALRPVYRDSVAGGGGKDVAGRAVVITGDLLKVGGTTVRLLGIEAPERAQLCGKDAGKWRCAEAAQSALAKLIGGRTVRCRLSGTDTAGRALGLCAIDAVDLNAELVRQGYAFADGGSSSQFGAQESEARVAKSGMWIGDAVRPAEFKTKAWAEAKHRAPGGCAIKGQVKGPERVYVLPGAPAYERLRVLTARGDRWFCTEQDATAAGFKAAPEGAPGA